MAAVLVNMTFCPYVGDYRKDFLCDTVEDAETLEPSCPGSTALVVTGELYITNSEWAWKPFGENL